MDRAETTQRKDCGGVKEIYKGMMLNNAIGICLDGSGWNGWLFAKHPDGQWVSLCKIAEIDRLHKEVEGLKIWKDMIVDDNDKHNEKQAKLISDLNAKLEAAEKDANTIRKIREIRKANVGIPCACEFDEDGETLTKICDAHDKIDHLREELADTEARLNHAEKEVDFLQKRLEGLPTPDEFRLLMEDYEKRGEEVEGLKEKLSSPAHYKEMYGDLLEQIADLTAKLEEKEKEVGGLKEKPLRIAWLIERTSTLWGIEWFCAGTDRWTKDANKAILFPDKASAEETVTHYGWPELPIDVEGGACGDWIYHMIIIEHGFIGG